MRTKTATRQNKTRKHKVTLDIVVPVFNEQETIASTLETCAQVFSTSRLAKAGIQSVHFIFIDDGSADHTAEILTDAIDRGFPARICQLSRNFGQQNAISAGIAESDADLTAIMDADLQDPPEVFFRMLDQWRAGFDVVYGVRQKRKEAFWLVFAYWAFYRLLNFLSDGMTPVDSGDFCLMDRRVVETLNSLPECLRFPRGLRAWIGFKQFGLEYERNARLLGQSKYRLKDLYRLATDGVATVSIKPLKIIQLATFCSGGIFGLIFVFTFFISGSQANKFLYLLVSFLATTTNLSLYILAAYLGRTYLEVKGRPSYIIAEVTGESSHQAKRKTA